MEVSSTSSTTSASVQVDAQKKAQDVQSEQVLKLIEESDKQTQEMTAKKTGIGSKLNIAG